MNTQAVVEQRGSELAEIEFELGNNLLEFRKAFITKENPTGAEFLKAAKIHNAAEHLIFNILPNGTLEEIRPDEKVNLLSGSRRFLIFKSDRSFRVEIERRIFEWGAQEIVGSVALKLIGADPDHFDLVLQVAGGPDKVIGECESIDLGAAGIEKLKLKPKTITIIVNGRPHVVTSHTLTYLQIVQLAYPGEVPTDTKVFTVTYKRGPAAHPQGTVVEGSSVKVKNKEIFNVVPSDKS